ncbi:unnamed protein product, partial [Rotaria sp. Silwood2]
MKNNEFDNNLLNLVEADQDVTITQSVGQIKIIKMDFNDIRIFDSLNPALKSSYFQVQINNKSKFIHKQMVWWLLTDKASPLSADRLLDFY